MDYIDIHRDIVERCKQGNRQAQFELYKLYSKAMYNICLRMVRNEADAEDLLQNAFIDIFTKLDSFAFQSSVGAWMKRIAINNCINFLKSRRLQFEELDTKWMNVQPDGETTEEVPLNVQAINKAINQLPDGYRVVFSLYALEGYDHEEIGEILGITESTSKSQYSRARQKLKELVKLENSNSL